MKLPDHVIENFNTRLFDKYGKLNNKARFRIVWSDDQFEKRWTNHTPEGFLLLHPEVREYPKYKQSNPDCYVLERLTEVPVFGEKDGAPATDLSYEPLWFYEAKDKKGENILPNWASLAFVIEHVLEAIRTQGQYVKYKDPNTKSEEALELQKVRIDAMIEELFGNESETGDALAYKDGVSYAGLEAPKTTEQAK